MSDLDAEFHRLLDALERAGIELGLAGSLAAALERGEGVGLSIDVLVWPLRKQCEEIALAPESAAADAIEALLAGWQRFTEFGRIDEIVRMAGRFPPGLIEREAALAAYLQAARLALRQGHHRPRCMFRYTLAGLEWA